MASKKENQDNIKLQKLREEWHDMAVHLSKKVPEGTLRDILYDQLVWLKKKLDYYKIEKDIDAVRFCFNEVVDVFNGKLKLKKNKFKKH